MAHNDSGHTGTNPILKDQVEKDARKDERVKDARDAKK